MDKIPLKFLKLLDLSKNTELYHMIQNFGGENFGETSTSKIGR